MFGAAAAYVVAIGTLMFCAASALTLFNVVEHFDPPAKPEHVPTPADFTVELGGRNKVAV